MSAHTIEPAPDDFEFDADKVLLVAAQAAWQNGDRDLHAALLDDQLVVLAELDADRIPIATITTHDGEPVARFGLHWHAVAAGGTQ